MSVERFLSHDGLNVINNRIKELGKVDVSEDQIKAVLMAVLWVENRVRQIAGVDNE